MITDSKRKSDTNVRRLVGISLILSALVYCVVLYSGYESKHLAVFPAVAGVLGIELIWEKNSRAKFVVLFISLIAIGWIIFTQSLVSL